MRTAGVLAIWKSRSGWRHFPFQTRCTPLSSVLRLDFGQRGMLLDRCHLKCRFPENSIRWNKDHLGGQYPKIGKWKKMKFSFFRQRHQPVLTFLQSPIEWLTFCQNWSTCCYFLWKKLNSHFLNSPIFGKTASAETRTISELKMQLFFLQPALSAFSAEDKCDYG